MVVNGLPMKRMKRRVTADLYDFLTFPSSSASGSGIATPFRANIRSFLSKHALMPPLSSLFPHVMTWQIVFRVGDATESSDPSAVVCLDVVEEDVARSRSIYCDQCRVVGWSGHPVCSKRYHFIINADGSNSIGGYHKPCVRCGDILHLSELRCKSCSHVTTTDDVEEWVYHQLEDTTHLLHGVIHSNGYGHLLRVNGREGGSRVLSGCHIMDFWDRLCKTLAVRKVSVMDVSKKYGLEYRLLHAITKGRPWYGEWGYEFGAGSFALTADSYRSAVETLSSLPLSIFLPQGLRPSTRLQDIISFYQSLSKSKLVNIKDLFCSLMRLIHDARKSTSRVGDATFKRQRTSSGDSSWSRADIARVEEAVFRVLRAVSGSNWVSSRALRGAVCRVAPPALLENCLMELRGKVAAEGRVVNARHNPDSGSLEYRLEPQNVSISTGGNDTCVPKCPPCEEILKQDLKFLYESMLHPQTMSICPPEKIRKLAISSAEKLLDCKQFVKHYKNEMPSNGNGALICISCELELTDQHKETAPDPPAELVVLPVKATVSDLKAEASKAFQEVYLAFRRFQAEELLGFGGVQDSTQVKLLIGATGSARLVGRCPGKMGHSKYRLERGMESWTVDCKCGARDDDGERMLACDVCGVWQHTRCSGIKDSEAVPAKFVCNRCSSKESLDSAIMRVEATGRA